MARYDNITVRLTGQDGNAFYIIGKVKTALQKHDIDQNEVDDFLDKCFNAESYDHLLQLVMETVNVE